MKETIRTVLVDYIKYKKSNAELRAQEKNKRSLYDDLYDEKIISIAAYPTGGLGDYIISSKLIDELMIYGPCKIDVYCENIEFGKAIFENRSDNMRIMPTSMYDANIYVYDLAMKIEHFVHVNAYNAKRLMDITPDLFKIVEKMRLNWDKLYLNIDEQCYRERIHFQQMEMQGLNRYTELRMGGLFKIDNKETRIPLREDFKLNQEKYKLDKYITFNYGADSMHTNKMQLKVWPLEYYEELFQLIKAECPDITIVQLGGKKARKAKNADVYLLGENLESIKWVLKDSMCHIDCEGGLVHMATQLGTHCVVIFGPTPMHMYAYDQNTNLVCDSCNNCMGIYPKWAFECYKGEKKPQCMYGITPERVFDVVRNKLLNEITGGSIK